MNPPEVLTGPVCAVYRGEMWWILAAVWAASVGAGWYVGRQQGGVDAVSDGIGWPLVLGPVGLAIFLLTNRGAVDRRQTQP